MSYGSGDLMQTPFFCCVIETCVEGVLHHTVNMV